MRPKELTLRGLILGALITTVFTAANVYLGLKVGLTFASSIPAAVISMAILSAVKDSSILENNIVQTVASAAGTLSAIIFVLPGLVIVGWWTGFPFWQSFLICVSGGILGVLFTIPLRRALVTTSDLPYPEGVAAAEVLKVGSGTRGETKDETGEAREGLVAVILGSVASAGLAIITATRIAAAEFNGFIRLGATASTGYNIAWSLALLGAGHLVGLSVGMAMLVGQIISWVIAVPILTSMGAPGPDQSLPAYMTTVWRTQVRFIGAGTIAVAAIYTLGRLARPVVGGLVSTLAASKAKATGDETDRDLSPQWILILTAACLVIAGYLAFTFARSTVLAPNATTLTIIAVPIVLLVGFLIAGVCGYMAGLIGASNSPISGVGILAVVGIALILAALFPHATGAMSKSLVAFALFVTAVVFGVATISNNNLQDLKTGQLVDATPWRQQVALILGVIFGALVIPPVLDLLNTAFTFQGAPGAKETALAAPQAALISAIAQGLLSGNFDWRLIEIGAGIGVVVIIIDEILRKMKRGALPPLAVGMGIYLPMALTLLIPIGALLGWFYDKWAARTSSPEFAQRMGVLLATGLIVGESIMGVVYAAIVATTRSDAPLAVVAENAWAVPLGIIIFAVVVVGFYAWTQRETRVALAA
jgi:putative OPT family oligopeptide transporter